MECSCVYPGDYDPPDFTTKQIRKARKGHKCVECGCAISAGDRYEHSSNKYDYGIDVFKTCLDCISMREVFFCDGWFYGGIWEQFNEYLRDAISGEYFSWSKLGKVTPTVRAEICEMIEELWEEGYDDENTTGLP
jgi:hypothetical protein